MKLGCNHGINTFNNAFEKHIKTYLLSFFQVRAVFITALESMRKTSSMRENIIYEIKCFCLVSKLYIFINQPKMQVLEVNITIYEFNRQSISDMMHPID